MRVVIQRVNYASVSIGKDISGQIGPGMLVLLGIGEDDTDDDITWLCGKIVNLRIFDDENGVMNKSVLDTNGNILLVSQFTLFASTKKGNRPSYIRAAMPEKAIPMYERCIAQLESLSGKHVETGKFGAMMKVELENDGPVTITIDSRNKE